MSAFHNSKQGEQLALAWHKFGTYVSAVMAGLSLVASLWCLGVGGFALFFAGAAIAAVFYAFLAFGFVVCALVAGGGVLWHRRAEKDHVEHLAEISGSVLRKPVYRCSRCKGLVGVSDVSTDQWAHVLSREPLCEGAVPEAAL